MKSMKQLNLKKVLIILLYAVVLLLITLNAFITCYLWKQQNQNSSKIVSLIIQAIQPLDSPLVTDPTTGREFIPEAKLVLPPEPSELGKVVYQYTPYQRGISDENLQLASRFNINAATSKLLNHNDTMQAFDYVPELQSCVRGIRVMFSNPNNEKPVATKLLANGKTAYFYTEPLCKNKNLLEYAEQLNSF